MRTFKWLVCVGMCSLFLMYESDSFTADTSYIISMIWMLGVVIYAGPES